MTTIGDYLADKKIEHADDILVCDRCEIVKHYPAGTLWKEIFADKNQHEANVHNEV